MKFRFFLMLLFAMFIVAAAAVASGENDENKGEVIYVTFCSVCHGSQGKGDGVSSAALIPTPPDFTGSEFKESFDHGKIKKSILSGVPDTQMEGYRDKLTPEIVDLVISHILNFE